MSVLACAGEATSTIRHVIVLLSLTAFLGHCACRISILPLRCLFCPMGCCIASFCLVQSRAASRIPCTMTGNLLRLTWASLLTAASQLLSCSSCSFAFSVLVVTTISPLGSLLAASTFPDTFWLFFLLISSTSWVIGRARSSGVALGHLMTISRARRVGISRTGGNPVAAAAAPNRRAAAYVFAPVGAAACCFCLRSEEHTSEL